MKTSNNVPKRILFIANWDWVLFNFRLPLARAVEEAGVEVTLVCPRGDYFDQIKANGFSLVAWDLDRRSTSPIKEWRALLHLWRLYRSFRPDAAHHFTIKPIVYGSLAARLARVPIVINNFTGLGYLFTNSLKARLLRLFLLPLLRMASVGKKYAALFQNDQDLERLSRSHIVSPEQAAVIPGTGVDLDKFSSLRRTKGPGLRVLMASRLLLSKGVKEFVGAAKLIKDRSVRATFWVAGDIDKGNPDHVPQDLVDYWQKQGVVEFLGHRQDMPNLLSEVDIAVLPTNYQEGMPLFLMEAAAAGLPIVATDIPGCRMIVAPGKNGYLVPVKDAEALAKAILELIQKPELRQTMGRRSRKIAEARFSIDRINAQYLEFYRSLDLLPE